MLLTLWLLFLGAANAACALIPALPHPTRLFSALVGGILLGMALVRMYS